MSATTGKSIMEILVLYIRHKNL